MTYDFPLYFLVLVSPTQQKWQDGTAFDLASFSTKCISTGHLAPAMRASATFPGLFTPVMHSKGILIDGAIGDPLGVFCLPLTAVGQSESPPLRILNVTLDDAADIAPPVCPPPLQQQWEGINYVRLVLSGLPSRPHPFAMERGLSAMKSAYRRVKQVLDRPMVQCALNPTCYYTVTGM